MSGGVGISGNLNVGGLASRASSPCDKNVTNTSIMVSNDSNTGLYRDGSGISRNSAVCLKKASRTSNLNSFADGGIFETYPIVSMMMMMVY